MNIIIFIKNNQILIDSFKLEQIIKRNNRINYIY